MTNKFLKNITKQQAIISASVIGVILLGLGWYFLIPPRLEKTCEHMVEVTSDEIREEAKAEGYEEFVDAYLNENDLQQACEDEGEDRADDIGWLKMVKERRCMLRADDTEDIEDCDEDED